MLMCEIVATEETALRYCREQGLIPAPNQQAPNLRVGEFWGVCREVGFNPARPECEGNVTTVVRRFRNGPKPQYRCQVCRKQLSQQHGLGPIGGASVMTWFASIDRAGHPNAKLSKRAVLWIMYAMVKNLSVVHTVALMKGDMNLNKKAVIDWRNFVREMMTVDLQDAPRMGGAGQTVQIDESLFRGRRKYNRGRQLQGDGVPGRRPNNHGQRVDGPWVFGLLHVETGELRLFRVDRRDADTLLPIVITNVAPGTTIMSDEWGAYVRLPACIDHPQNGGAPMQYVHQTVNHSVEFVDAVTGANTQRLEREWERCKGGLIGAACPWRVRAPSWWRSAPGLQPSPPGSATCLQPATCCAPGLGPGTLNYD